MNTKKKKSTAGKGTSETTLVASSSSSLGKKKGSNNNNNHHHENVQQRISSSSSASGGSPCGGQNHVSSSAAATAAGTSGQQNRTHLTKHQTQQQQSSFTASRRMGHETGHGATQRRQNAPEADDLPLDCSFGRRRVHHQSGSGQSDRSDDVVNTNTSNKIYHVRERDEHLPSNGLRDSEWISVPIQRPVATLSSTSMSSLTSDCSDESGSDSLSPPLSQITESVTLVPDSHSTQPKRTAAAAAVRLQQQPLQQSSPTAQSSQHPAARTKPQMDREERVKSLAKQANLLIDEGMMLTDVSENNQIDKEKIGDAIRLLDVAIKIDANDYRLFINRGYCYEVLQEYDKALEDADKAVALRPDWANCYFRRGFALAGLEKFQEAEKSFMKSQNFDSKIADEVVKEVYKLRLDACLNWGFPVDKAREAADQTNSVAEAIQFAVETSPDQPENFPATDFPIYIKSGSVSSSSSFCRTAPGECEPSPTSTSSPSAPSASNNYLWPDTASADFRNNKKRNDRDSSEKREMPPPHHHAIHIPSNTSNSSNGSILTQRSVVAAAAALVSDMNGSGSMDHVLKHRRVSGDEPISSANNHSHNSTSAPLLPSVASKPMSQKEILVESVITNRQLFHFCPDLETRNEFGWFALWIGNISPNCSNDLLREMFCIFGELVHCKVYPSDDANDVSYALAHYDNDKSPITAMAEYQGAVLRGVSARDKLPLVIRFRPNKEQKERLMSGGNNNNINWSTYTGPNNHFVNSDDTAVRKVSETGGGGNPNSRASPDPSHQKKATPVPPSGECYFWRTTGCRNESGCRFAHNPQSKAIDYAPFMKKMSTIPFQHSSNNNSHHSNNNNHPLTGRNFRK